jgi:hypothetical protein
MERLLSKSLWSTARIAALDLFTSQRPPTAHPVFKKFKKSRAARSLVTSTFFMDRTAGIG